MGINIKYIDGLSNAHNIEDLYYNNDAQNKDAVIQAAAVLGSGVVNAVMNRPKNTTKQDIVAVCGRKPIIGKNKKAAYQKCVENYLKTKNPSSGNKSEDLETYSPVDTKYDRNPNKKPSMKTGLLITIGVLAAAGIGFAVYKLVLKK
jgi:hypothetical protein